MEDQIQNEFQADENKTILNPPMKNRKLSKTQKISLFLMLFIAVSLPITTFSLLNTKTLLRSRADVITPPSTPPVKPSELIESLALNGNSYIEIKDSSSINPQLDFTAEAWVKPNTLTPNARIVNKLSGSQNSFSLSITSDKVADNHYVLRYTFSVVNSGNYCVLHNIEKQKEFQDNDIVKILEWQHIAGVVTPDGSMQIYVNGEKSTSNSNKISGTCQRSLPVTIGARKFDDGSADGFFDGLIDEVRISNIARYNDNFTPFGYPFKNDANNIALYHFDGNLSDASGNGYDGIGYGTINYIGNTTNPPTTTPVPTKPPVPTTTPTPIPYYLLIPNSATNKSCNDLCITYGLTCKSTGNDINASNSKGWQQSKSSCVQTDTTCSTIMKRAAKKICSGYQTPWTNCKCGE